MQPLILFVAARVVDGRQSLDAERYEDARNTLNRCNFELTTAN
jgi:hypothetical protein